MSDRISFYRNRWFPAFLVVVLLAAAGLYYEATAWDRDARKAEESAANYITAALRQDSESMSLQSDGQAYGDMQDFLSSRPEWHAQDVTRTSNGGRLRLEAQLADGTMTYVSFEKANEGSDFYVAFHITTDGHADGDGSITVRSFDGWKVIAIRPL